MRSFSFSLLESSLAAPFSINPLSSLTCPLEEKRLQIVIELYPFPLHIFIKKKQKTPVNELEIARKRLKELKNEGEN